MSRSAELQALKQAIVAHEEKTGHRLTNLRKRYNRIVTNQHKNQHTNQHTNQHQGPLQPCSTSPMTGFRRDGYCMPHDDDRGRHLVCAELTDEFLEFTAEQGNDLSSVASVGDRWCLCETRYLEAKRAGKAPRLIEEATHVSANIGSRTRSD